MRPTERLMTARQAMEHHSVRVRASSPRWMETDWASMLEPGAVHEWFLADDQLPAFAVGVAVAMASRHPALSVIWIGERAWPFARLTAMQSVRLRTFRRDERVWAIDCALRCSGLSMVVADAAGLSMPESRRLQLAAEAGGTLGLLMRPSRELRDLSVARTRWRLTPLPTNTKDPHWTVELLRCKGMRPTNEDARQWIVRRDHATSNVHLVSDAADQPLSPSQPARRFAM